MDLKKVEQISVWSCNRAETKLSKISILNWDFCSIYVLQFTTGSHNNRSPGFWVKETHDILWNISNMWCRVPCSPTTYCIIDITDLHVLFIILAMFYSDHSIIFCCWRTDYNTGKLKWDVSSMMALMLAFSNSFIWLEIIKASSMGVFYTCR